MPRPSTKTRSLVIGAGSNELVAAQYLVKAGHGVLVLDTRLPSAGAPATSGWVPPAIIKDLSLDGRGLQIHESDPWVAAPLPGGGRIELWRDMGKSVASIGKMSARDAARWPEFCERMARLAGLLERLYLSPAPDPMGKRLEDLAQLAGVAIRARLLGRQGLQDLLRLLPMSAADFLDDWFESDVLKGVLGAAGVMHLHQGPRSGGTAFSLLHHHVGCARGVFRPSRSNIEAVARAGIELRAAEVAKISVREGRVTGVVLSGGEEIAAAIVVSGADPKRTLLEWIDPGWLDPELVRALRHVRSRGAVARVDLALGQAPGFHVLAIAPSLDYLERAYDDAKYRRVSQAPYIEARAEPGSEGRHRVSVHFQYAPYSLGAGTWDEEHCRALGDAAVKILSDAVPEIAASVVESVLSPVDLERLEGWPQGQAYHAELALDQVLWMRPVPDLARYRTPIQGLYLCGPAMHPGAGVAGAAGRNAARQIIKDLRC